MFEGRIAASRLVAVEVEGFPPALDALAEHNLAGHGFLRAAWYRASLSACARPHSAQRGRSLLVQRAGQCGSFPIAAIPTIGFGPALLGARRVAGAYWPLRAALIGRDCDPRELAAALALPAARRALGPIWRLGPARADCPATARLVAAAEAAGWQVLARPAGTCWVIDCAAARAEGWPRASTAKRMARIERRLGRLGPVSWSRVRGAAWSAAALDELAAIEAASWIAARTDGSGAKFLHPHQRALWLEVLADPALAAMLCATILKVGGKPVAFSFDLIDGQVQYGIAGSYVQALARHEIGKLANHRALADAIAGGIDLMDLGAGDSGYKREIGARAGYELVDLLIVRPRLAARLIAPLWAGWGKAHHG
ncbi:GNAT family N-acetyltransferase [Erythrobacter cryptus]|uniref:GNAT family N-acetyltransferase n=1 Tax=Erythrobacter cryptus TaxID=196588 RepID=UPI00042712F4|nr:GNAT family N-acetyltransferase [Erythrobacter cryptus]